MLVTVTLAATEHRFHFKPMLELRQMDQTTKSAQDTLTLPVTLQHITHLLAFAYDGTAPNITAFALFGTSADGYINDVDNDSSN